MLPRRRQCRLNREGAYNLLEQPLFVDFGHLSTLVNFPPSHLLEMKKPPDPVAIVGEQEQEQETLKYKGKKYRTNRAWGTVLLAIVRQRARVNIVHDKITKFVEIKATGRTDLSWCRRVARWSGKKYPWVSLG